MQMLTFLRSLKCLHLVRDSSKSCSTKLSSNPLILVLNEHLTLYLTILTLNDPKKEAF